MNRVQPPSQLTAEAIRRAMDTLHTRTDLPPEARTLGIASLQEALDRLYPSYAKIRLSPIRRA